MTNAAPPRHHRRNAAIAALFDGLDDTMARYRHLPDADRERCWDSDAHRITGEIARHLDVARSRLSATG